MSDTNVDQTKWVALVKAFAITKGKDPEKFNMGLENITQLLEDGESKSIEMYVISDDKTYGFQLLYNQLKDFMEYNSDLTMTDLKSIKGWDRWLM